MDEIKKKCNSMVKLFFYGSNSGIVQSDFYSIYSCLVSVLFIQRTRMITFEIRKKTVELKVVRWYILKCFAFSVIPKEKQDKTLTSANKTISGEKRRGGGEFPQIDYNPVGPSTALS